MKSARTAVLFVLLLLFSSLSLVVLSINKGDLNTALTNEQSSMEVIVPLAQANVAGFQEGSIFTNQTLASGGSHTCAILDNGSVSCWGDGANGQLGNGGTSVKSTPTLTSSLGTGRSAVALSSGQYHTCAILDNGSVSCWGDGANGQLGNGGTSNQNTPTLTSSLGTGRTAVALSSGESHTCAILDNGSVSCWGYGNYGQLGNGGTSDKSTPTLTSSLGTGRTAVALSSGGQHTCAVLDNGSVSCWGYGTYGQLGNGLGSNHNSPSLTSSLGAGRTAVALSSGGYHTCAILDNGSVSCWGDSIYGQLGNGGTAYKLTPTLTSSLGTNRTAVALSSGQHHTCAILDDDSVSCWGAGGAGQLGNGGTSQQYPPTLTNSLGAGRTAVALSSGSQHTCAILDNGFVSCWGSGGVGQMGSGGNWNQKSPTLTSSLGAGRTVALSERDLDGDGILNIFDSTPYPPTTNPPNPLPQRNVPGFQEGSIYTDTTLSSDESHTCAILDNGSVACWGRNNLGQLGDGTTIDRSTPVQTSSLGNGRTAIALTTGSKNTCAILDNGSVSCWGYNGGGELGNGNMNTSGIFPNPTQTSSLGLGRTAVAISASQDHTCAILDDGSVRCWGRNVQGQLGDGTNTQSTSPIQTSSLGTGRTAVAISTGAQFTCVILDDGSVSCWGENGDGNLGDGTSTTRNTPALTSSLGTGRTAVAISSGYGHTCVILDNGSVSCWGNNYNGALGDGTSIDHRKTPAPTSSLGTGRTAVSISVGGHACAILDDGNVSCWGSNYEGQLGDGTTTNRNTPVQTSSFGTERTAVGLAAGSDHTCAILDDATVSCWGHNDHGRLGDGTSTSRSTPAQTSSFGANRTAALSERDLDGDGILNIFDNTPYTPDPAQWEIYEVSGFTGGPNANVGTHSSIAVDLNGDIHLTYRRESDGTLRYSHYDGNFWNESVLTVGGVVEAYHSSIAIDSNGTIHIAYANCPQGPSCLTGHVRYINNEGGIWNEILLESTMKGGWSTSLAINSSDIVHVVYGYLDTPGNNHFIRCAKQNGTSWDFSFVEENTYEHSGGDIHLQIDSNDIVSATWAEDQIPGGPIIRKVLNGGQWVHSLLITNQYPIGGGSFEGEDLMYFDFDSFSDVNGTVHFSLRNTSSGDLEYYSFDGNSWNEQIIDANDSIGTSNSIVVDSLGNVHIVYYDSANTSLKIASNFSGTWLIEVIDNSSDVGSVSSLFLDPNDTIHIVYYDSSAKGVKYATKSMNGAIPGWALDTDNDGIDDSSDDCPNDAGNSTLDQVGCPDLDGDGYSDSGDLFPSNPSEWSDTDGDGTGDNSDSFPDNANETMDSDGDGVGNNADAFPNDGNETSDSDGDGVGDNGDSFPNDGNETSDSDGDGVGDNADVFPDRFRTKPLIPTSDGVGDNADAFPNNSNETADSDNDGLGDNEDDYPFINNFIDSDGDEIPDLFDDFINDPTQWSDYDGDGYGDYSEGNNSDAFINNATQWSDTDGDGYGDNWGNSTWNTTRLFIWPGQFVTGAELADHCPTEFGNSSADGYFGCLDVDGDGIADMYDDLIQNDSQSNETNGLNETNETASIDSDADGVDDLYDLCPNTVLDGYVDIDGCLFDQDGDGVDDLKDACPDTKAEVSVNVNGCVVENEEGQSFLDSLSSGDQGAILQTVGVGAIVIALLGFLQTNMIAALLPDSVRWLRVFKGNSKLIKEEIRELEYLKSLVQTYYQDTEVLVEELFQLKSELTARYTNSEIKKVTREKLNTLITDLLEMGSEERSRIAHSDAFFGLGGALDTKERSEYLSQDILMRTEDSDSSLEIVGTVAHEQPATPSPSVIPTPSKTISGEVNQEDGYEYLESPPGSKIWFVRENSTSEWTRWVQ